MVNNSPALDSVFSALADPIRRRIVQRLSEGSATVGSLAKPFKVSAPAVSRHLRVLERAGLIRRRKHGRIHEIELAPDRLRSAVTWMESCRRHWESSLDSLARFLESSEAAAPATQPVFPQSQSPSSEQNKETKP